MKNRIIFLSLILLLGSLPLSFAEEFPTDDWFPFALAPQFSSDSPVHFGKFTLETPAGRHGFLSTEGSQFVFDDGTRGRFWGTNLTFGANFPDRKAAKSLASRLAFLGFNIVRFHHLDFYFEPDGIFEDIAPDLEDPQKKPTGRLSEKQLDRLDYFIAELKKRGLYINFNLLVSRHFTEADGVADAANLSAAAKPISLFDPKLITLQKQYARDLLTHFNPYTELRYNEDPAIAFIEITNENSLVSAWKEGKLDPGQKKSIPDHYLNLLDEEWRNWLKKKSRASEDIPNRPTFSELKNQTADIQDDIQEFYVELEKKYYSEILAFLRNECAIKVPIGGSALYTSRENSETLSQLDYIDVHVYWDHPKFPGKSWDRTDFRIENKPMLQDSKLGIVGKIAGLLKTAPNKPIAISEWNHCYPNSSAYETPLLMAAQGLQNQWDALYQFSFSKGWKVTPVYDEIQDYFDTIGNPQQLILNALGGHLFLMGEETSSSIENDVLRIESPKLYSVSGEIKDRLWTFENFAFHPKTNGTLAVFSLDKNPLAKSRRMGLVVLSEVRNTDSGWEENGKFNWGSAPTELKQLDLFVEIKTSNDVEIKELDPSGSPKKEVEAIRLDDEMVTFSNQDSLTPWFEIELER